MSAVWLAARGAVRRRRLQTVAIGVVVFVSAVTIVVALSMLIASANPFGQAFAAQNGAHLAVAFDPAQVTDAQLAQTTRLPSVTAAAGPFAEATVNITSVTGSSPLGSSQVPPSQVPPSPVPSGPLTVVGRASPGGPVDDLDLWQGHWATGPGQIVIDLPSSEHVGPQFLGSAVHLSGGQSLTVVGVAYSASQSAGAWVAPAQIAALHPDATQVLYRFASAATATDVSKDLATVTAALPRGALLSAQSYLTVEQNYSTLLDVYTPLMLAFGIIALAAAVLIVANVIGGAVVSGYRHIGVLKATGYTPDQVTAVYLIMVGIPALAGVVLGTVAGTALAGPFASAASQGLVSRGSAVSPKAGVITLAGLLAVVIVTALGAALRARRLPAARAISAGTSPGAGRGLRAQRALAGTRLPRAVSLGLGLPFARPARTGLTLAAVALGVLTVTMCIGLTSTAISYGDLAESHGGAQVTVTTGQARQGQAVSALGTAATQTLLRSLPGAVQVDASWSGGGTRIVGTGLVSTGQTVYPTFVLDRPASMGTLIVKGHWIDGPYQAVAPPGFLQKHDVTIGSRLTLDMGGKPATVTIVGETWSGDADSITADWQTLTTLKPAQQANTYGVQLASGTSVSAYMAAVSKAAPGLYPSPNDKVNAGTEIVATTATLFTVLLAIVAALGVFNTVLLSSRERRRDLGMLKSIGMTPREATLMMVTSMAELGILGTLIGLPLGILAHRLVVAAMSHSFFILPAYMINVWNPALVAALASSGLVIAVLGAYVPARSAGRLTIATVLHNE